MRALQKLLTTTLRIRWSATRANKVVGNTDASGLTEEQKTALGNQLLDMADNNWFGNGNGNDWGNDWGNFGQRLGQRWDNGWDSCNNGSGNDWSATIGNDGCNCG